MGSEPAIDTWALDVLCCPHCRGTLAAVDAKTVGCAAGHHFDRARQGYLPLLGSGARTDTGDDATMVAARERFLAAGHYAPIAERVAGAVAENASPSGPDDGAPVIELGAGTGYYLSAAIGAKGRGVALDSSKYALRRAARQPGVTAVLADAWSRLPLRSGAARAALSIFAPRDPAELLRILVPAGIVVVVTPEPDHLAELRSPLGLLAVDADKAEHLVEAFAAASSRESGQGAIVTDTSPLRYHRELTRTEAVDVAAMGPAARHVRADELASRAATLSERTTVTVSVSVTVLRCGPADALDRGRKQR